MSSVPNNKLLDVTKLKAFADDKINVAQMMIFVFDRVENILKGENGKRRKCWLAAFSPFPTMLSKRLFS